MVKTKLLEQPKSRTVTTPNTGKNVEQQEFSFSTWRVPAFTVFFRKYAQIGRELGASHGGLR